MVSGIEGGLACCEVLCSDHVCEELLSVLGYFDNRCGLEYGAEECGVDVRDKVREVGLGSGACAEQCLECAVL